MAVAKPILIRTRILDYDRTALAADDADYTINRGTKPNIIFVAQLDEEKGAYASTYTLMWKNTTDAGSFTNLAATGELNWAATTSLVQGTAVTSRACTGAGASGSTWQDGEEVEGAATCDSINLADEYYTEVHFAINVAGAKEGKTYDFQVWENTGGTALAVAAAASLIVTSDQPSVVLNTADETEFATDTPTLEFTGTDASDSDVRYNIQIGKIFSSYNKANQDTLVSLVNGGIIYLAQSFTGDGSDIAACRFYLKKVGSPTGNAVAKLFTHSGEYGVSSVPNSLLATSDVFNVATLTTDFQLITFTFPTPYTTDNGTYYCIDIEYTGGLGGTNYIDVGRDSSSPTSPGNMSYYISSWVASASDYIYDILSVASLDKLSGTDLGFANTTDPPDTDPFDSGDKCDYDVQAGDALADGTYYWRVRGMDPSPGSGSYGSWAATRSFVVDTAGGETLVMADGVSGSTSENIVLTQAHTLAVNGATSASASDNVVTVQNYTLAVAAAVSEATSDTPTLAQNSLLVVGDGISASTSDAPVLTQLHNLTVAGAISASASDNLDLVEHKTLAVADATSTTTADNLDLVEHKTLAVGDAVSASTSDNLDLIENKTLEVAGAVSESTSENIILTENKTLVIADAVSETISDNVVLDVGSVELVMADAVSATAGENINLVQHKTLAVDDAASNTVSENIALIENKTLAVGDATSAATSDNLVLTENKTLEIADSVSATIADNIDLTQAHVLAVNDAATETVSDNVVLVAGAIELAVSDAVHAAVSDNIDLIQHYTVVVQDGTCTFRSDEPGIIQHFTLAVGDAVSESSSEEPDLAVCHILAMQDAAHAMLSDSPSLIQDHALTVQNAVIGPYSMIITPDGMAKRASNNFYVNL